MLKQIVRRTPIADHHLPDNLHPIIKQIYAQRGVKGAEELSTSAAHLLDFKKLKDIEVAASILAEALKQQKRIMIVGDFDADGATSTAVLMSGLPMFGFNQVEYKVPDRFTMGYGLSEEMAQAVIDAQAEVLITVDNGISSIAGVALAKAAGLEVIVIDHHLPGEQLPNADAIVNPNQVDCRFPSKALAGVGVAFYLLVALRAELRSQHWFTQRHVTEPNIAELLDLVALGTVADVVPLDANNRILVAQGLARIRKGRTRPGVLALIEAAGRRSEKLQASDFGFAIGPRLNAAGRLDDMGLGINCLLSTDQIQAHSAARQLDQLNHERRQIEQEMQWEAESVLSELRLEEASALDAICLYQQDWHQGVIGILAGRMKEKYHRPAVIFAASEGGEIKGSCRSVPGLHMRDLLETINSQSPGIIKKFGGHAMAAGLTINEEDFEFFSTCFNRLAAELMTDEMKNACIYSDGELSGEQLSMDFASQLQQAGPWGQAFPEPIFDGVFEVIQQRLVGEKHLKLMVQDASGRALDAIYFNVDLDKWPNQQVEQVRMAYQLDINEFRGQHSLQLMVRELLAA